MNRSIPKHANFFVFIDGLKIHESRTSDEMYNAINDKSLANFNHMHKVDRERDENIRVYTKLLCNGTISTGQFLENMAECNQCMYIGHVPIHIFEICTKQLENYNFYVSISVDTYLDENGEEFE